jgi:2-phospho-L-lactate/phosphoenolpyruvate guanylyltransferase
VLAIVPVKGLDGAKTRLAGVLSPSERAELVLTMLDCVLEACAESAAIDEILVVTPDERVARGDAVLVDEGAGHAPAIARALADPRARGGAVVVMADCPLVLPEAIDRLAEAAQPVAIARATDGGMNALAVRDPAAFEPAFGVRHSARRTDERARAAGVDAVILDDPLLAFDVDRPADLERLRGLVAA